MGVKEKNVRCENWEGDPFGDTADSSKVSLFEAGNDQADQASRYYREKPASRSIEVRIRKLGVRVKLAESEARGKEPAMSFWIVTAICPVWKGYS